MYSVSFIATRLAPIVFTALSISSSANAGDEPWNEMDLYISAGFGQSSITPHHITSTGYVPDDRSLEAWKLTGGLDINDHISIEGYYSDLGNINLSSRTLADINVGYRMTGADVIFHYWTKDEKRMPGSIALYAKAGLNHTETYHSRNFEENNRVRKLFGGLGAEMYLKNHFSVRFEFESYNADASLISLNLVKRFGFNSRRLEKKEFVAMVEKLPITEAGPKIAFLVPVVLDSDLDGVLDDEDQCLDTLKNVEIDESGCENLKAIIDRLAAQLKFDLSTDTLTQASQKELDRIVDKLTTSTAFNIEVQVYADNKNLSEKRAEAVISYLVAKGISSHRISALAYGKENPVIDANSTASHEQNPRVEFILTTL